MGFIDPMFPQSSIELQDVLAVWAALAPGVLDLVHQRFEGGLAGEVRVVLGGDVDHRGDFATARVRHCFYTVIAASLAMIEGVEGGRDVLVDVVGHSEDAGGRVSDEGDDSTRV